MDGTVSGEHAIGIGKKQSLEEEVGGTTIAVMRALKRSLDPYWLMNPGKIFDHELAETDALSDVGKSKYRNTS